MINNWVRYPRDDEMMMGIRCFRPASALAPRQIDGQDFMDLQPQGRYVRRYMDTITSGHWEVHKDRLTLMADDSRSETFTFNIEGDRLFTSG